MINELQIENFKCFQQLSTFKFSRLNLLTGINGRGKSSLLQSILLLSQSADVKKVDHKVVLNGRHIDFGNYKDIKNSETLREDKIFLKLTFETGFTATIKIVENESDLLSASFDELNIDIEGSDVENIDEFFKEIQNGIVQRFDIELGDQQVFKIQDMYYNDIISKVHYVSADRLGPVKYVDKISFHNFISVGARGEHTINVLANENLPLTYDKLYLGRDSKSLLQQTQEWLAYILEGANIEIKGREADSSILYMLMNNKNNSYKYRPSNIGYGYSYILPLIVTGLLAREGEIIIIENPEAHLHPRAQSRISEFFTKIASCGIQVFIESHSEHILNGLRVSALNPSIEFNNEDLTIHYFNEVFSTRQLKVDAKGKVDNWPTGFFDQQEIDLSDIFTLGTNGG